ncbi:histidine phosphatase family protein [Spirilliplanes yamanashiensis]|uniref:Phosphoglycerate mutase n=1 Tax=Spirilliplanes yamanashiensis TaxID=42233 RepID=A0A8J3Y3T9_9ACTN|nr:histidine phosphatase family protein [Spirilliplanes yamanashiensis]MDP9820008.1 broad specificity phosphatase PhoE [Spirilliplanes yamanashiensis]GIJ01173.1 phosphoglycerate mutase [Spirilliplanes yamanashiensis]
MRLVLISHAATAAVRAAAFPRDEPLDAGGQADAAALAGASFGRLHRVLTSPARSCRATATALRLTAEVEPALRDADPGRWAGRALDEVAAAEPDAVSAWVTDPAVAPPGGESVAQVRARVTAWAAGLPESSGGTLAVTHPAVIRVLVLAALDAPDTGFWRLDVPPLTRTVLRGHGDRWTVRAVAAPI